MLATRSRWAWRYVATHAGSYDDGSVPERRDGVDRIPRTTAPSSVTSATASRSGSYPASSSGSGQYPRNGRRLTAASAGGDRLGPLGAEHLHRRRRLAGGVRVGEDRVGL